MLKGKHDLLRRMLDFIFGPVLIVGGVYLEFSSEIKELSQSYLYTSIGLLCIFTGTMLLVDGILSCLEGKSDENKSNS